MTCSAVCALGVMVLTVNAGLSASAAPQAASPKTLGDRATATTAAPDQQNNGSASATTSLMIGPSTSTTKAPETTTTSTTKAQKGIETPFLTKKNAVPPGQAKKSTTAKSAPSTPAQLPHTGAMSLTLTALAVGFLLLGICVEAQARIIRWNLGLRK